MGDLEWQSQHAIFEQTHMDLMDYPIPVIAPVNGARSVTGQRWH